MIYQIYEVVVNTTTDLELILVETFQFIHASEQFIRFMSSILPGKQKNERVQNSRCG